VVVSRDAGEEGELGLEAFASSVTTNQRRSPNPDQTCDVRVEEGLVAAALEAFREESLPALDLMGGAGARRKTKW
jgi:hypothetical protein